MTDADRARVVVVVVTYNSAAVLGPCLDSLAAGCAGVRLLEVIVADNASQDDTLALARRHPQLPLRVLQLGRNGGYSAGLNEAVATLRPGGFDAVLLLNPDVRVRPGAVAHLAAALHGPRRGVAVPRLVNPDGSLQPSLRRAPTLGRALAEAVLGGPRAERFGPLAERIVDPRHYREPCPAAWATGAAMLMSAAAVAELGPWDEDFLLYSEETEYALRAWDHGWQLWYEPTAVMEHIGGRGDHDPTLFALLTWNRVQVFRRRHGLLGGLAYHAVVLLGEIGRAALGRPTSRAAIGVLLHPSRRMIRFPDG